MSNPLQPREVLLMAMDDCIVSPVIFKAVAKTLREDAEAIAASEQRNRELQEDWQRKNEQVIRLMVRLDAAEKLVARWREVKPISIGPESDMRMAVLSDCITQLEAAISPTPDQPVAGDDIDCVRCGNKHSGGC